jgi:hypothetical protein
MYFAVLEEIYNNVGQQLFNLSQLFNYTPYLFCKKRFKTEINSFCICTQDRALLLYMRRQAMYPLLNVTSNSAFPPHPSNIYR